MTQGCLEKPTVTEAGKYMAYFYATEKQVYGDTLRLSYACLLTDDTLDKECHLRAAKGRKNCGGSFYIYESEDRRFRKIGVSSNLKKRKEWESDPYLYGTKLWDQRFSFLRNAYLAEGAIKHGFNKINRMLMTRGEVRDFNQDSEELLRKSVHTQRVIDTVKDFFQILQHGWMTFVSQKIIPFRSAAKVLMSISESSSALTIYNKSVDDQISTEGKGKFILFEDKPEYSQQERIFVNWGKWREFAASTMIPCLPKSIPKKFQSLNQP